MYEETVAQGRQLRKPGADAIAELVDGGVLTVHEVRDRRFVSRLAGEPGAGPTHPLHRAEAETLALARELGAVAIIDEVPARSVTRIYRIEVHGTFHLLVRAYRKGALSKREVRRALDQMVREGWRIRAEDYARLVEELEHFPSPPARR